MNKGKLIILGFDGMDYDLTRELIEQGEMPNLKRLSTEGQFAPLQSVLPPDSIPAWITAFTGLDPSEHGILDHVNYLLPDSDKKSIDTTVFHEKTFWDRIAADTGKSVCVINPFMAYPVWPVKGVMVSGPVFIEGEIQSSAPELTKDIPIPDSIGGITNLPKKSEIEDFLEHTLQDTREQAAYGMKMLESTDPGLFFQTFLTSDRIQHHLWRYCDKTDPTYPGRNPVENGITEFFQLVDKIVGDFMATLSPEDTLLIMSDHGHGIRCTHTFNINEFFRRKGYVKSTAGNQKLNKNIIIEKLKNRVLRFMNDHDLEDYISTIAKLVPNAKEMKKGSHITSHGNSMAYATDFAGTNPFGGIRINREKVKDYTAFRRKLMDELADVTHEGEKIFRWLKIREDIYSGSHIDRYPDILYEMPPRLGTGFSNHCDLVTVNPTHKKISGGHKANGVFFINHPEHWVVNKSDCKVSNIYASLLSIFGINVTNNNSRSFICTKN
ncbi:MAG: alkaline phosphatase family protein [Sedimenticola sp.]